jgi:hypothetical protein
MFDSEDLFDRLRKLGSPASRLSLSQAYGVSCEAIDRIRRLEAALAAANAEVERLSGDISLDEVVKLFNEFAHRSHGRWRITMGKGDFDAVCCKDQLVYYPGWEAKAIARVYRRAKLLRDGGEGGGE